MAGVGLTSLLQILLTNKFNFTVAGRRLEARDRIVDSIIARNGTKEWEGLDPIKEVPDYRM